MKKRALSILLALTLCFTVLAGIGSAAPQVNLAKNVDRLDKVLTKVATDAQQAKIQNAHDKFYEVYPDGITYDGDWKVIIDRLVTPELLEYTDEEYDITADKKTLPYFFMRWVEDRYHIDGDTADYPAIEALAVEFDALNEDMNVGYESITAASGKFREYGDASSDLFTKYMTDAQFQAELQSYLGGDAEADAYKSAQKVAEKQVKIEIAELLQKTADFILSVESGDSYEFGNYEGNIYDAYVALYHGDEVRKNLSIIAGETFTDLLSQTNGAADQFTEYAKGKDLINTAMEYQFKIFNGDKDVVFGDEDGNESGAYALAAELLGILNADIASGDAPALLGDVADALAMHGYDIAELYDTAKDALALVDRDRDVRNIWFNLGLNRVLNLVDEGGSYKVDPTDYAQKLKYDFDHRIFEKYGDKAQKYLDTVNTASKNWFYLVLDGDATETDFGVAYDVKGVSVELTQGKDGMRLLYDATKMPEGTTVKGTIYRGSDKLDPADETDRYIKRVEIKLHHVDVPVKEKSIAITAPTGETFAPGAQITIKGTSEKFELIAIYIQTPDGQRFLYETVTAEEFANGIIYRIPDDAVFGEYKVFAGDAEKVAESNFYVGEDIGELTLIDEQQFDYTVTGSKNATFASLKAKKTKPVPSELKLTANNGDVFVAEITWNEEEYDPKNTSKVQTIHGTYEIPAEAAGYAVGGNVDLLTEINIKLGGVTPGPGTSTTYYAKYIHEEMHYNKDIKTVTVKGDTNLTKVIVELVGADGTVYKTMEVTQAQLKNGFEFDLSDLNLPEGSYTLYLLSVNRNPDTIYDRFNFNTGDIDSLFTRKHVNYIMGFNDGTVRPEANISRDEVAAILFRLLNDDARAKYLTDSTAKFSDLHDGIWSMTPIATLTTAGIINGYPDGTFGVGKEITRAEFAALISRFGISTDVTVANPYSDITGNWAEKEILAVTAMGWFEGYDGKFRPNDTMTRAEVVTVMNRILGRTNLNAETFSDFTLVEFSDLDTNAWYYLAMVEATNNHDEAYVNGIEKWSDKEEIIDWTQYEK